MALGVCLITTLLSALVNQLLPHKYEAEMKLLVNNKRVDFVMTPGEAQSVAPPPEVSEAEVNSEIELLKSHDIMQEIVMDHRLYAPFEKRGSPAPSRKSIELATEKMGRSLKVTSLRKTNIIDVTYRDEDPDTAAAILKEVGDRYLASHLLAHGSHGSAEFFTEQVAHYDHALQEARRALSTFQQDTKLFSLPQQQTLLVQRLGDVSSKLEDTTAQVHVLESRMAEGSRQLTETPERVLTQVKQTSDQLALQQLEPTLSQLQNHRIELLTKFLPTDRMVIQVDQQIANTQKELDRIRAERMDETTTDLDAVHQSIKAESSRSGIDLQGLRTQRAQLIQMKQESLLQLAELERSSVKLEELQRTEKEAQDSYNLYVQRLNEARLAGALDRDNFSNVSIIEKPASSPIPVTPKLSLNLAAGMVFGLLLSSILIFFFESGYSSQTMSEFGEEVRLNNLQDVTLHATSRDWVR